MRQIDYSKVPEHMRHSIRGYIERGQPVGDFLTALLSNDLMGAFGRADMENTKAMRDWAAFLYNEAPGLSWGSPAKVEEWINMGGLEGIEAKRAAKAAGGS